MSSLVTPLVLRTVVVNHIPWPHKKHTCPGWDPDGKTRRSAFSRMFKTKEVAQIIFAWPFSKETKMASVCPSEIWFELFNNGEGFVPEIAQWHLQSVRWGRLLFGAVPILSRGPRSASAASMGSGADQGPQRTIGVREEFSRRSPG